MHSSIFLFGSNPLQNNWRYDHLWWSVRSPPKIYMTSNYSLHEIRDCDIARNLKFLSLIFYYYSSGFRCELSVSLLMWFRISLSYFYGLIWFLFRCSISFSKEKHEGLWINSLTCRSMIELIFFEFFNVHNNFPHSISQANLLFFLNWPLATNVN